MLLKSMKVNRFQVNVILGIANGIISALQTLWFIPYIKSFLGNEAYGYVSVINGLVNTLMIISVSVGVMSTRFIVVNLEQGNKKKASHYYSTEFFSLLIIGLLISILGIILSFNLRKVMNISSGYYNDVQILFLMTLFSFLIQLISAPFSASFYVKNSLFITYLIFICDYLSRIMMTIFLFSNGEKVIWSSALATDLVYLGMILIYYIYTRKNLPELILSKSLFKIKYLWDVMRSGLWVGISYAGNVMLSSLTTYFSNIFCGVIITGIYSAIMQLNIIENTVLSVLISSILPKMFKLYSNDDNQSLYNYVIDSMILTTLFIGLISSGIVVYGSDFMSLWMGKEFVKYRLLIVLTVIYLPFTLPSQVINQVFTVKNKVAIPAIATLLFGMLNVFLIIIFTKWLNLGIYGIAISAVIVQVLRDDIFYPLYLKNIINRVKWKLSIPFLIGVVYMALGISICFLVKKVIVPNTILSFSLSVIVSGILLFLLALTLYRKKEHLGG